MLETVINLSSPSVYDVLIAIQTWQLKHRREYKQRKLFALMKISQEFLKY